MEATITKEQFNELKQGDVIWWRSGKDWYARTVIRGPANSVTKGAFVQFPKWKRGRYPRTLATYDYNGVKYKISVSQCKPVKTIVSRAEYQQLQDMGFDVKKEFKREKAEHDRIESIPRLRHSTGMRCSLKQMSF